MTGPEVAPARQARGKASWYAECRRLTAAHRTLPMGTRVTVTNVRNRRSVTVTIADRGPFIKGRIIDLCKDAFEKIENPSTGVVDVVITW